MNDNDLVTDTIAVLKADRPDALNHLRALYAVKLAAIDILISDAAVAVETIDADELEAYAVAQSKW